MYGNYLHPLPPDCSADMYCLPAAAATGVHTRMPFPDRLRRSAGPSLSRRDTVEWKPACAWRCCLPSRGPVQQPVSAQYSGAFLDVRLPLPGRWSFTCAASGLRGSPSAPARASAWSQADGLGWLAFAISGWVALCPALCAATSPARLELVLQNRCP